MRTLLLVAVALGVAGCSGLLPHRELAPPPRPLPVAPAPPREGAIFRAGYEPALFEDLKPRRVGDILTVVLVEATDAQKSASTTTGKSSKLELADPTLFGQKIRVQGAPVLSGSAQASRDFDGSGASSQSNKLSGSVTVTVIERLANGNLAVSGEKQLTLNQGEEYVQLSGIVRPADIAPDNSILSSRVADARIVYSGDGALSDSNAQGWLSRFFNSPWWPL